MWTDENGYPSKEGNSFAGVVVCPPGKVDGVQPSPAWTPVATRGIVPVWVSGQVRAGAPVMAAPGANEGKRTGILQIGTLAHGEDTPDTGKVLAMVRLGIVTGMRNPFEPHLIRHDTSGGNDQWFVTIFPGSVVERVPKYGTASLVHHMPKIGGTELSADPPPELEMASGDIAYAKVFALKTGAVGVAGDGGTINPDIPIIASTNDGTGQHYIPAAPSDYDEAGQTGEMWFKLFKFEVIDGAPRITLYRQSDIEWDPYLWSALNIGVGVGLYSRYNKTTGKHELRSVAGIDGILAALSADRATVNVGLDGGLTWDIVFRDYCCYSNTLLRLSFGKGGRLLAVDATEEQRPIDPDAVTYVDV